MIVILFLFTFIIYHVVVFSYSEVIFSPNDKKWNFRIITAIFNILLFSLYYFFSFYESVLFIVFPILIFIEFYIGYDRHQLKCLFGTLCFATNFFAVRLVIMAISSLYTNQEFGFFVTNQVLNMQSTILTFIVCSLYITIFRYTLTNRYINTIQSSESNTRFATKILFCMFVFQIFNTINGYVTENYAMLPWLQLKIGICIIVGFCAALLYAYLLSRLDILKDVSMVMEKQIVVQQKESKHLENMAYIDQELDCYSRTYGLQYLENTIKMKKENFSVIFFDLDGLKLVNDKYGHLEGDFYIKNIVEVLKNIFADYMVCRMGGDEFMVVLHNTDEFDAYRLAVNAYESVILRSQEKDRTYHMSVSYGVLEVNIKSKMNSDKILKSVDEKMYAFKNSRKKTRFM